MSALKVYQQELVRLFINIATAFNKDFPRYNEFVALEWKDIPLAWQELPSDSRISHLHFDSPVTRVYARCHDNQNGEHIFVT